MVSGYNRDASVSDSSFAYLGGSAMAGWGYTTSSDPEIPGGIGIDGTNGNQPHGTRVVRNICRELGTQEKQSSCKMMLARFGRACRLATLESIGIAGWFQAKTQESTISHNLFFNGPRAMINMNE